MLLEQNYRNYTFRDVCKYFQNLGCYVNVEEKYEKGYKNCKSKIEYYCVCDKRFNTSMEEFIQEGFDKQYETCDKFRDYNRKDILNVFDNVKKDLENTNYKIITPTDNFNLNTVIKYVCNKNHVNFTHSSEYNEETLFCEICEDPPSESYNKEVNPFYIFKQNLTTYEDVFALFENSGCKLITKKDEYKNKSSQVKYQCECGVIKDTIFNNFMENKYQCCISCAAYKKSGKDKREVYENLKHNCELEGYVLLEPLSSFDGSKGLKFKCKNSHDVELTLSNFKVGMRCNKCVKSKLTELREELDAKGFVLKNTDENITNKDKIDLECKDCHSIRTLLLGNYRNRRDARICKNKECGKSKKN